MPDLRICDRCERDVPLVYAGPLPLTALHLPGWGKSGATCVPEEVRDLAKRPKEDHDDEGWSVGAAIPEEKPC